MAPPRALGVDDFAFKKGHHYGTILVDLERRRTIDLLPDRSAESLAKWLRAHPGVEVIARDRSGSYAEGAREGAAAAVQVADRWHLIKNLADALEPFLARHRGALSAAVAPTGAGEPAQVEAAESETPRPVPAAGEPVQDPDRERRLTRGERDRQWRRARRLERYEQVCDLYRQGFSLRAIGRKLDLDRRTVRQYVQAEHFPEIATRARRSSVVDPYSPYILGRWEAGCHNGAQIFREMKHQGYPGARSQVMRYLAELRARLRQTTDGRDAGGLKRKNERPPSARRVVWLFVCEPSDLTEEQQGYLARLWAASEPVRRAYELARAFLQMVRKREAGQLLGWLEDASDSEIPELRGLAKSLRGDLAAVKAGLSLPWSNGPTEGSVHRLKMIKRQMYGRAGFDLLRQRVLHTG
jgi:transposase